jgi:hypothetical protein
MTCPIRFRRLLVLYDTPENAKRSHRPSFLEGLPAKQEKQTRYPSKEKKKKTPLMFPKISIYQYILNVPFF